MRSQSLCAIDQAESDVAADSSSTSISGTAGSGGSSSASNSTGGCGGSAVVCNTNRLWTTKEANACVLTALMLCLVPV